MDKDQRIEVLLMLPGEQLDALVSERLFGKKREIFGFNTRSRRLSVVRWVKSYSTDIRDAQEVLKLVHSWPFSKRKLFFDELQDMTAFSGGKIAWPDVFWTITPERICKAALLAYDG